MELEMKNREYEKEIERLLKEKKYLENYMYAEYAIKAYINDDHNYQKGRFLRKIRSTGNNFKYCVETIKFLNPILYQEYLEAVKKSEVHKKYSMNSNINRIARGIETGFLSDGTPFDLIEFYRYVPFREKGLNFVGTLKDYMRQTDGIVEGAYDRITQYMRDNEIYLIIFATESYILRNKKVFSNDPRFTDEVIHNIFRYMYADGLPRIEAIFKILLKRYLDGELDFDDLDAKEAKSIQARKKKELHNPYTLNRVNE